MKILKIHTGPTNSIWVSSNNLIYNTGYNVEEFVKSGFIYKGAAFVAIGCTRNLELLLKVYDKKLRGEISSLKVCSPGLLTSKVTAFQPEKSILSIDSWKNYSSSIGGWHEFSENDFITYYIASNYLNNRASENTPHIVSLHPAWKYLSFIPGIDMDKCSKLFAIILDPRWFVDLCNVDRNKKLECYLGLIPKVQKIVKSDKFRNSKKKFICKLVMDIWKTSSYNTKYDNNFLWKYYQELLLTGKSEVMAELRVSQKLLSFIKLAWLDELYKHNKLFVPKYFFRYENEAISFSEYINEINKQRESK